MTPVVGDCPSDGDGGSFFMKRGTCTVYFVRIDDKILHARDVVVENVQARAVVEIVLAHI